MNLIHMQVLMLWKDGPPKAPPNHLKKNVENML
jgi:hypothetical protein